MRKTIHRSVLICVCLIQAGCVIPQYSPHREPPGLGDQYGETWERLWSEDDSDKAVPYRDYGGVI